MQRLCDHLNCLCIHRHTKRPARTRTQCKPFSLKCLFVNMHRGEKEWDRWMHWEIQNSMHCRFDSLDALVKQNKNWSFFPLLPIDAMVFSSQQKEEKTKRNIQKMIEYLKWAIFFSPALFPMSNKHSIFDIQYSIIEKLHVLPYYFKPNRNHRELYSNWKMQFVWKQWGNVILLFELFDSNDFTYTWNLSQ